MEEIWVPIITWLKGVKYDYEGLYQVSSEGRVRSLNYMKTGTVKVLKLHKGKYIQVELSKKGEHHYHVVQRLVWEAFNGPIPEGYEINHINENKADNRLENLSLVTHKENINWGTRNKRAGEAIRKKITGRTNTKKPNWVEKYDLNNHYLKTYYSPAEAARLTGICRQNIMKVCLGQRPYAGKKNGPKYIWRYKEKRAG